jgi:hypothetical protein
VNGVVEIVVDGLEFLLEPFDVALNALTDVPVSDLSQAIPFGTQHLDKLSATGNERFQGSQRGIGQRAWFRTNTIPKQGKTFGVDAVGFRQSAERPCESRTWRGLTMATLKPAVPKAAAA